MCPDSGVIRNQGRVWMMIGPAHRLGAVGGQKKQVIDGQAVEPVTDLADELGHPQSPEVRVTTQKH